METFNELATLYPILQTVNFTLTFAPEEQVGTAKPLARPSLNPWILNGTILLIGGAFWEVLSN